MSDDQTHVGPHSATPAGRTPGSARGTALKAAALLLPTVCLVAGAAWWLHVDGDKPQPADTATAPPPGSTRDELFYGWPEPDFVLVLSAQQHGYLQPCGCSDPQYGGLERRFNFIESLRLPPAKPPAKGGRGWPVVAYDLGDVPQTQGPAKLPNIQGLIKYRYSMEALKRIGYAAVSFGEFEAAQPLNSAIDEYALNNDKPAVLAANLLDKADRFPDKDRKGDDWGKSYVGNWQVTPVTLATSKIKVGALGIIGTHTAADVAGLVKDKLLPEGAAIPPSVGGQITATDPKFKFANGAVPAALTAMAAQKPDFRVLLYQGPVELAKLMPKFFPKQFNVILCISQEDEPPGVPVVVDDTFIIRLGHKGKNVGVVGVSVRPGKPFAMRYQLVPMGPQYKTPPDKDNPILALLESYAKELKAEDYLAQYGKIAHSTQASIKGMPKFAAAKAGYAGSETCSKCHAFAHKVWAKSDHARAYKTLVEKAEHPSLREYDPECIVCHTVGFRYNGGFENATKTPKLKDVGCESCHGPCELHKQNPNNKALRALINPWKAPAGEKPKEKEKRQLRIESMCRECHDAENDVHWRTFVPKWDKIAHPSPDDEPKASDDD